MPKICKKCNARFPFNIRINGKIHSLNTRNYCLNCSPFKSHNTKKIEENEKNIKKCNKCKIEKDINEFNKKYSGKQQRQTYCKTCWQKINTERQILKKEKAIQYLGGKCRKCGFVGPYPCYDFHHIKEKNFAISRIKNHTWEKIQKELDNCILLCANCHRIVHYTHIA